MSWLQWTLLSFNALETQTVKRESIDSFITAVNPPFFDALGTQNVKRERVDSIFIAYQPSHFRHTWDPDCQERKGVNTFINVVNLYLFLYTWDLNQWLMAGNGLKQITFFQTSSSSINGLCVRTGHHMHMMNMPNQKIPWAQNKFCIPKFRSSYVLNNDWWWLKLYILQL